LGSHPSPKAQPAILSDVAGDEGLLIDPKMRFDGPIFRFRQIFFQIFSSKPDGCERQKPTFRP
jgi:hypothetical protein